MVSGLAIGVVGAVFDLSVETIVATASPAGVIAGVLGLSLPWARQMTTRVRARASMPPEPPLGRQ